MRRAPAKPVRACILRKWCPVSHVIFEAPLRTPHFTLHTPHFTLHSSHCTLLTAFFTLHTSHLTLTLHTSLFTLHSSLFTLHSSLFTLRSSRPTLHTALFRLVAEHRGETHSRQKRPQPQPPHTRGTFHRRLQPLYTEKYKVSCSSGFLPKTKPMQHSCSHYNAFCSGKPASLYAHGNTRFRWQQSCSHSNAIRNLRFNTRIELRTQEQPLVAEHRGGTHSRQKRPQPQPPHTRGTFHRRLQPLYTEKIQGFVLRLSPQNKTYWAFMQPYAAITMRFAASRGWPASLYAHGNTRLQQPCSHSTAICNHRSKKRIELRTQEQPLVAEHREGTHSQQKRPQPQPPHTRGTFHRRLQPLYTEKYKVSCSGFLPKSLTPKFHTKVSHQSLTPKSHTKVSHHPSLSVFLCDVKSDTTLHWVYCYR